MSNKEFVKGNNIKIFIYIYIFKYNISFSPSIYLLYLILYNLLDIQ